jgi:hypothetical protein
MARISARAGCASWSKALKNGRAAPSQAGAAACFIRANAPELHVSSPLRCAELNGCREDHQGAATRHEWRWTHRGLLDQVVATMRQSKYSLQPVQETLIAWSRPSMLWSARRG